jgi:DNA-binding transcriptional LysR family regulator
MDEVAAFVAAAEELHLGRAAETLGVARTTLSSRLRRFEAAVGLCVVDRTHRCRIAVTQAGAALLPAARRMIAAGDELIAHADEVREGRRGVVRVARMSPADAESDEFVAALREVDDGWTVETVGMDVRAAGRAMAIGAVEVAIGRGVLPPRTSPGLLDPRPNRLERVRVAGVGTDRCSRLTVAWRTAWAGSRVGDDLAPPEHWAESRDSRPFEAPDAPGGGSPHAETLVGLVRRKRVADADRQFPERAARRRAAAARREARRREAELYHREVEEFGRRTALERASARDREDRRAKTMRRMREAVAKGAVPVHLLVDWWCVVGPGVPLPGVDPLSADSPAPSDSPLPADSPGPGHETCPGDGAAPAGEGRRPPRGEPDDELSG